MSLAPEINYGLFDSCLGYWDKETMLYTRNLPKQATGCCMKTCELYHDTVNDIKECQNVCAGVFNDFMERSGFDECDSSENKEECCKNIRYCHDEGCVNACIGSFPRPLPPHDVEEPANPLWMYRDVDLYRPAPHTSNPYKIVPYVLIGLIIIAVIYAL